jgi:hypothetical protein
MGIVDIAGKDPIEFSTRGLGDLLKSHNILNIQRQLLSIETDPFSHNHDEIASKLHPRKRQKLKRRLFLFKKWVSDPMEKTITHFRWSKKFSI